MSFVKKIRSKIYSVSKKAGDRLGFDLPYFVENGFWMLLNQGVVMLSGLLTSVLFARLFDKSVYGKYQFVLSLIGFIAFFSVPGLNASLIRSVARGYDGDYRSAVRFSFVRSLFGSLILFFAAFYYLHYSSDENMFSVLLVAASFFPFMKAPDKWQALFKGKSLFDEFTKRTAVQTVARTLLIIVAVLFFPDKLLPVFTAYVFGTAFFHVLWYFESLKFIENDKKGKDTFTYGIFLTKLGVLNTLVNHFDKIIVGLLDIKMLAVYSVSLSLVNVIKNFIKSVSAVTFPKFAGRNADLTLFQMFLIFVAGFSAAAVSYFFADDIIRLLYTDKYSESVKYFKFFVLIIPLFALSSVLSKKILAQKEERKLVLLRVPVPLLTLILSVSVFVVSKRTEYFILTKFFLYHILNFAVLILPVKKKK